MLLDFEVKEPRSLRILIRLFHGAFQNLCFQSILKTKMK